MPTVEEALAEEGPTEPPVRTGRPERMITGSPANVRDRVDELLQLSGADEVMAMTNIHAFDDRLRSYELLAEAFGLEPRPTGSEGSHERAETAETPA